MGECSLVLTRGRYQPKSRSRQIHSTMTIAKTPGLVRLYCNAVIVMLYYVICVM